LVDLLVDLKAVKTVISKVEMKVGQKVVWSAVLKAFRLVDLWVDQTAG